MLQPVCGGEVLLVAKKLESRRTAAVRGEDSDKATWTSERGWMAESNGDGLSRETYVENDGMSAREPWLRRVFAGSDGLRSGWSFALYVSMFALVVAVGSWWGDSLHLGALWSQLFSELGLLVAAVIPALVMGRIERRPWDVYGLPLQAALAKLFWVGAVWGFLGITLLVEILHLLHAFDFGHVVLREMSIVKFAAFWAGVFLLVGFFEEFLLRGYTQFTLARGMGFWPAAVLLSTAFGASHLNNPGEAWTGALAAGVIGLFLCLTLRRTGNLWFAVGFHAAWDWGESFFYSVPDSGQVSPGHLLSSSFHGSRWITGGSVGPEGSVLCFVVIAVAWVAFARTYPAVRYRPELTFPRLSATNEAESI
jgi:membrane protease YdiL (CAAX protease family)